MAVLSTGTIENRKVMGNRPSSTLAVRFRNKDLIDAVIQIRGFYFEGTAKKEYVLDSVTLRPGSAVDTHHYAEFDQFEFQFVTSSDEVEVSAWGKNSIGNMTVVYKLKPIEIGCLDDGTNRRVDPSCTDRIYAVNSSHNSLLVIDAKTKAVIATVAVGENPKGVGVNPVTNRVYVANQGSNNVSVIDGFSNAVIGTVLVGDSPEEVNVDSGKNQIYITNRGSNTVSVINGSTHTVIATIQKK